jgi:hypothetical protein
MHPKITNKHLTKSLTQKVKIEQICLFTTVLKLGHQPYSRALYLEAQLSFHLHTRNPTVVPIRSKQLVKRREDGDTRK